MRGVATLAACAALALGGAAHATQDAWLPATAADGAFTVDTPCSSEEIAQFSQFPDLTPGFRLVPESRVVCKKGGFLMVAGIFAPEGYPEDGPALFDLFEDMLQKVPGATTIRSLVVDGRRTIVNREERDGSVAQTQVIEFGHSRAIMIIGGYGEDDGLAVADQHALVDRFFGSVRVHEQ
ncbi:hypothetical protein [Stakelama tenebrarum]|uniref:DUF1795 domain-containing protein n=1 Tax=Stakelama tenebrarum TaxID=2711215 RepID=A0A6G6Y7G7_9SPHN|nr:hypothetical protein [Sphingosinithalassobacter tenebrarum]QIG80516.1 hypothetical protein G5C33_12475 [Sphingosinithalassobacter tenebrarum]